MFCRFIIGSGVITGKKGHCRGTSPRPADVTRRVQIPAQETPENGGREEGKERERVLT